jgi:hypothetical protein
MQTEFKSSFELVEVVSGHTDLPSDQDEFVGFGDSTCGQTQVLFFIVCDSGNNSLRIGQCALSVTICRAPSVTFNCVENYNTQGTNIDLAFFDFIIFISESVYINCIPLFSNVSTLYTKIHVHRSYIHKSFLLHVSAIGTGL